MITLGIETSCDETALALIETRIEDGVFQVRVISSLVHSQAELHSAYGGVFPALAKREHGKNVIPLFKKLLEDTGLTDSQNELLEDKGAGALPRKLSDADSKSKTEPFSQSLKEQNPDLFESLEKADFLKFIPRIDRIAVTEGPGLEPALWVGIIFARLLSALYDIPVTPVNHMEGHIVGSLLRSDQASGTWQTLHELSSPAIALLVSGGHTELVEIGGIGKYRIIGQTVDDAVGEAYDKAARLLGLPYPGGPYMSMLAGKALEEGVEPTVKLPRPMLYSKDLNFSFSGLKTAVLYAIRDAGEMTDSFKKGLALEFERAVSETLSVKLKAAIDQVGAKAIVVGGGVSANHVLRKSFADIAEEYGIPLYLPTRHVSGDNALMIALAGALDTTTHSRELKAHGTKRLGK